METVKEILLVVAFVIILLGALFIGGRYLLNSNTDAIGASTIQDVQDGKTVVLEMEQKNNKNLNRYIEKYDDKTIGYVAYILSRIQVYSVPVCTLLFVIGAFLYWVISAKKFVEAEKGYGYIVSSIIFLAIAQVAPLVFALIVSTGRG